jgi:GntR family transcriptional regulator, sialic acid-inducible nan operon repressor
MDGQRRPADEQPRNQQRIYQNIAMQLAQKINTGELADGSLLPSERELAEMFGASRTSVREALLSLQSSGLICVRDRARARVTRLQDPAFFKQLTAAAQTLLARPNGVADFQEVRELYECGLARYAAKHASRKELDRLGDALYQNKKAVRSPELFVKSDMAFHDVFRGILSSSRSTRLFPSG